MTMLQIKLILLFILSVFSNQSRAQSETPVFENINQCCSLGSYRAKAQDEACDDIKEKERHVIIDISFLVGQIALIDTLRLIPGKFLAAIVSLDRLWV